MSRPAIAIDVRGGRVSPVDVYGEEQLANLPDGRYNMRVSKVTRAGREQREGFRALWWAGCNLLAENTEGPMADTSRKVHEEILRGLGFVRPRFRVDGSFDMVVVSTSESEMDDEEFATLQERARAYAMRRWGFDPWLEWVNQQENRP